MADWDATPCASSISRAPTPTEAGYRGEQFSAEFLEFPSNRIPTIVDRYPADGVKRGCARVDKINRQDGVSMDAEARKHLFD